MGQTKGRFLLWFTALFIFLQVLATVLMIYGQRLAYFFSEHIETLPAPIVLIIITFMSIGTFLATYMVILKAEKKRTDINFFFYLMVNGFYGFCVSVLSIMILSAWWG